MGTYCHASPKIQDFTFKYFLNILSKIHLFSSKGKNRSHFEEYSNALKMGSIYKDNLFPCIILACNSTPVPKLPKHLRLRSVGVEEAYYHGDRWEQMVTSSKAN